MKKNRMMRLASGLLVAVLATTSMISGTYAKYVTSASASDVARVAKWGVEVETSGYLFGERYENKTNGNIILSTDKETMTVASVNRNEAGNDGLDSVVAPGTKNEEGITFSITGTPEVAVDVKIDVTDGTGENSQKDVFLKAGTYNDLTTGASTATKGGEVDLVDETTDTFEFATDYYPVVYTLTGNLTGDKTKLTGNLAAIAAELEALSDTFVEPNTDLGTTYGTYKLTWEWAFEKTSGTDEEKALVDKQDTLLGWLAVNPTEVNVNDASNYGLTSDVQIAISVTQVD